MYKNELKKTEENVKDSSNGKMILYFIGALFLVLILMMLVFSSFVPVSQTKIVKKTSDVNEITNISNNYKWYIYGFTFQGHLYIGNNQYFIHAASCPLCNNEK